MSLRQAKVDIGQGRGNAMTNAIVLFSKIVDFKGMKVPEIEDIVFKMADSIFHYNQVKIDQDYKAWFETNDKQLRLDTGVEVPTINEEQAF